MLSACRSYTVKLIRYLIRPVTPLIRRVIGVPTVLLEEMPDCPGLFHCYRRLLETGHERVPGGWIYGGEFYPDFLTVGGNSFAIRDVALKYCAGKGLDIGAGFWPLPGSTPIDTEQGPGLENNIDEIPDGTQDYVFSSHCLEHIADWETALEQWINKLNSNGVLFLYLPHHTCKIWHMSNPFMKDIHYWIPTIEVVSEVLERKGMELVDRKDGPDLFQSFFVCYRRKT